MNSIPQSTDAGQQNGCERRIHHSAAYKKHTSTTKKQAGMPILISNKRHSVKVNQKGWERILHTYQRKNPPSSFLSLILMLTGCCVSHIYFINSLFLNGCYILVKVASTGSSSPSGLLGHHIH